MDEKIQYSGVYRAKAKQGREWITGELNDIGKGLVMNIDTKDGAQRVEIDPGTVCMWTGKFDNMKEKIFHCDILAKPSDEDGLADTSLVTIKDSVFTLYEGDETNKKETALDAVDCSRWRVIGNVFDDGKTYGFRVHY
jgi:hypothetical protein